MYIGIDVGTGSLKAVIGNQTGIYTISEKYSSDISIPGMLGIYKISVFHEALERFMKQIALFLKDAADISSNIGLCGQGPSLIMIDPGGKPVNELITWQDGSAFKEAVELSSLFPNFTKDGTCFEAKLLKLYRSSPSSFEQGCKALYPKDYLQFLLTGELCLDHSTASTLAFYNHKERVFNTGQSGIPKGIFPRIIDSWDESGITGTEVSRRWGLPDGIKVFSGGIDAWCESLGAGALSPGDIVDGTGTSTCITCCKSEGESGLIHVIPERKLTIETMSSTGGAVKWGLNLIQEKLVEFDSYLYGFNGDGGIKENRFDALQPVSIIFLPYLNGERSPVWDEKASVSVTGLHGTHDRKDFIQGLLQGIGFGVRQCLEIVNDSFLSMGTEEPGIRAVGGGASGRTLIQLKADITNRPYKVMKIKDASALGAMILAAFGAGEGSLEELVRSLGRR